MNIVNRFGNNRNNFESLSEEINKSRNLNLKSNQLNSSSLEEVKNSRKQSFKNLNFNIDMPRSYQFEKKSDESAFKPELNIADNKLFESVPDFKTQSKVIPFKEYSNASRIMKANPSKGDEITKFSNMQPNFFNSNFSKQKDGKKDKFRRFNILYDNSSTHKLVSGETNMDLNSYDSPRLQSRNMNFKDHGSPIEETKYASLRQVTNASIAERDDRYKQAYTEVIEEAESNNFASKRE